MKLSLYNGKQQKDHIDETLERLMAQAGWQQSFKSEFFRLGLGYAAVAVALYVYYLEKTVAFRESRYLIGLLCAVYFSCTWGAWLWERTHERRAFYIGFKDGEKGWIATDYPKHSDRIEVTVTKSASSGLESERITLKLQEVIDKRAIVHDDALAPVVAFFTATDAKPKKSRASKSPNDAKKQ